MAAPATVNRVNRQVAAALRRAGYHGNGATLVVGVSGGADSSTLLYSLHRLREMAGINLHVAHLNHDFRGDEADEDARFVEGMAGDLGLPVTVEKRDPLAYQRERRISSFEQGAREMRYDFMAAVAHRTGAVAVAVGHTADDLAETVLLHLLRGAGLPGLRGMTEVAPWPWPTGLAVPALFRPLLAVTKQETMDYCRELGRDFRQDSGNTMFRFTRNRVRQDLLPHLAAEYNPRIRDALVRLAHTSALELDYLERETDKVWPDILIAGANPAGVETPSSLTLDRAALAALHPALRRLALRRAYVILAGDARRLRESHLAAMSDLAEANRSGLTLDLPAGLKLRLFGGRLILSSDGDDLDCPYPTLSGTHPLPRPAEPGRAEVREIEGWRVTQVLLPYRDLPDLPTVEPFTAGLDAAALGIATQVRAWQPGDRFQPLGMAGSKKLQDFFTDERVPRPQRGRIPLLVTERGIAWVVGQRIAEWAKVQSSQSDLTGQSASPAEAMALLISFEQSD